MRATLLITALMGTMSCADKPDAETGAPLAQDTETSGADDSVPLVDLDFDGFMNDEDCDDGRADVFPGAEELCNGLDDNCNGVIDEEFTDIDHDGEADCIDTEECDGADNDGDGLIDEGLGDADGDGIPDCQDAEECDGLDNDSDGAVDEGFDADGDGYTSCSSDCDDSDAAINPGAEEIDGDDTDNNCDSVIDDQTWTEGDLIIVEIMNNPGNVSDPAGEWFEIVNMSDRQLWLNGLVIQSTVDEDYHVITAAQKLLLDPGATAILGSNSDSATNGEVAVDYAYQNVSLSNEVDDILLTIGPKIIDQVSWNVNAGSPDAQGASLGLDPYFYDVAANDGLGAWCSATEIWESGTDRGSPGAENEVCEMDHDGDGYQGIEDCDDYNASINPDSPFGMNSPPVASAGADETYSESVTCVSTGYDYECDDCGDHVYTLDGSGSTDADGHELRYAWALIDGEDVAALSDEDQAVASLRVDGPSTEYGETETSTVTVQLTVTDCAGTTGTDQITVTFECSGD